MLDEKLSQNCSRVAAACDDQFLKTNEIFHDALRLWFRPWERPSSEPDTIRRPLPERYATRLCSSRLTVSGLKISGPSVLLRPCGVVVVLKREVSGSALVLIFQTMEKGGCGEDANAQPLLRDGNPFADLMSPPIALRSFGCLLSPELRSCERTAHRVGVNVAGLESIGPGINLSADRIKAMRTGTFDHLWGAAMIR